MPIPPESVKMSPVYGERRPSRPPMSASGWSLRRLTPFFRTWDSRAPSRTVSGSGDRCTRCGSVPGSSGIARREHHGESEAFPYASLPCSRSARLPARRQLLAVAGSSSRRRHVVGSPPALAARTGSARPPGDAQEVRLPGIEPPTLDPGLAQDLASIDVINQLFDGLVALDALGRPGRRRRRVLDDLGGRPDLHLHAAPGRRRGPTASRSPPRTTPGPGSATSARPPPRRTPTPSSRSRTARRSTTASSTPSSSASRPRTTARWWSRWSSRPSYFLSLASTWTLYPAAPGRPRGVRRPLDRGREHRHQRPVPAQGVAARHPDRAGAQRALLGPEARHPAGDLHPLPGGRRRADAGRLRGRRARHDRRRRPARASGLPDRPDHGRPGPEPAAQELRAVRRPTSSSSTTAARTSRTSAVRKALGMALDRRELLDDVIKQAGDPASGIQPEGILGPQAGRLAEGGRRRRPAAAGRRRLPERPGLPGDHADLRHQRHDPPPRRVPPAAAGRSARDHRQAGVDGERRLPALAARRRVGAAAATCTGRPGSRTTRTRRTGTTTSGTRTATRASTTPAGRTPSSTAWSGRRWLETDTAQRDRALRPGRPDRWRRTTRTSRSTTTRSGRWSSRT